MIPRKQVLAGAVMATVLFGVFACNETPGGDITTPSEPELGKGGKGKPAPDPALIVSYRDALTDKIRSDSRGDLTDGVCGVYAKFNLNDATVDPDRDPIKGKEKGSCGESRAIVFKFDDPVAGDVGPTLVEGAFMNADQVETVTLDDGTVPRFAQFNTSHCRLQFLGSNGVLVTRTGETTWDIEALPPNDVAACADGVRSYHMPFKLEIRLKE